MNRFAAFVLLASLAGTASAQLRTLPADAERGEIRHVAGMTVNIDGIERQLAPGAQIRNADNLIIVPAAIPSEGATAKYRLDSDGSVRQVWILSPREASERDRR
jgi:hypothetical protein